MCPLTIHMTDNGVQEGVDWMAGWGASAQPHSPYLWVGEVIMCNKRKAVCLEACGLLMTLRGGSREVENGGGSVFLTVRLRGAVGPEGRREGTEGWDWATDLGVSQATGCGKCINRDGGGGLPGNKQHKG